MKKPYAFLSLLLLSCVHVFAQYPKVQQGPKLFGTGMDLNSMVEYGSSVAISDDGNTVLIGAPGDDQSIGAVWVWTRNDTLWTQQGNKFAGTNAIGNSNQGWSVDLSADGNTAVIGGYSDNSRTGAIWVFTRSGGSWSQQGEKLVVNDPNQETYFGYSVGVSGDGNTIIAGAYKDSSNIGAAYIFKRSAGIWSQVGGKLTGTGAIGNSGQGYSVAISADGNTAVIGGDFDDSGKGAIWVWVYKSGIWQQQGNKLVGTGAIGGASQGSSVSLSADGNTIITGGRADNNGIGAVWTFRRSDTTWSQVGTKLVADDIVGVARFGNSVSISNEGNVAIIGGENDNYGTGAAWIFSLEANSWTPVGNKFIAADGENTPRFGYCVSIAGNSRTAVVGGPSDGDTAYGAAWIFVSETKPIVHTTTTSAISATSAIISGDVIYDGGETILERGIVYSASSTTPTIADSKNIAEGTPGLGSFTNNLLGLTPLTYYFARAYATNTKGTSYGDVVVFTTLHLSTSYLTLTLQTNNVSAFGLCDGSASLSVSDGTPPYTYQWNTGETGTQISNKCSNKYSVIVTDSRGIKDSVNVYIAEPNAPIVNPNPFGVTNDTLIKVHDTCIVNYELPIDSAHISSYTLVDSSTVRVNFRFYQGGTAYDFESDYEYTAEGNTLIVLDAKCTGTFTRMLKSTTVSQVINIQYNQIGRTQVLDAGILENLVPKITVYPNPTNDVIHIGGQTSTINQIIVLNQNGVEVLRSTQLDIDLSELTPGTYYLRILDKTGTTLNVEKVVLQ